jgi:predicted nucleic acid-binding protein
VIVVDASVLAAALADDGPDGRLARHRLRGERLLAPALIDLEVTSVLRRAHRAGRLTDLRVRQALADLAAMPMQRMGHPLLLRRIWALRANVTPYDAAYVALAETMNAILLTADARLAHASGPACTVEVLAA